MYAERPVNNTKAAGIVEKTRKSVIRLQKVKNIAQQFRDTGSIGRFDIVCDINTVEHIGNAILKVTCISRRTLRRPGQLFRTTQEHRLAASWVLGWRTDRACYLGAVFSNADIHVTSLSWRKLALRACCRLLSDNTGLWSVLLTDALCTRSSWTVNLLFWSVANTWG